MKRSWKNFQIVQFLIFLSFSFFLFIRTVDGHGTIQTLEIKMINFEIWTIFYIGILVLEWLIYFIIKRIKNNH